MSVTSVIARTEQPRGYVGKMIRVLGVINSSCDRHDYDHHWDAPWVICLVPLVDILQSL